jgi:ubiquinone/menaquinone biosynthesis C-methylase UbiE
MSLSSVLSSVLPHSVREFLKGRAERRFWRKRASVEGVLRNDHYVQPFTALFDLSEHDYAGKSILDVGCGPRGSLEWAHMASERVGVDPLADTYRSLGTDRHGMAYVAAPAETMPFEDGHFDFVSSFNSLDHVVRPDEAAREMVRVLSPGGLLLLIVEVEHEATLTEPHRLHQQVVQQLFPTLEVLKKERFAMDDERGMYGQIAAGAVLPEGRENEAHIVVAKLRKPR